VRLIRICGVLLLGAACAGERPADIVVYGATWTGDADRPWAEAVAIRGETIVAVGDSATIAPLVGSHTEVLAASGMVVPGLIDDHAHFMSGGFQLASVELRDAATPAEFARRIGDFARTLQPGEWILGGDWDHELWPGGVLPQRDWIDSLTPDNPVFVTRLDGHMGLTNSLALELAGVADDVADTDGGVIIRYPGSRRPTGLLKDNAMDPVWAVIPRASPSQRDSALARAMNHAAQLGVTSVAEVNGNWGNRAAVERARAEGRLTVRVALFHALADWHAWADTITRYGRGDEWVRLQGVKGFVDGSLGSTTAAFDEPYDDEPETAGTLVVAEDRLRSLLGSADSAGLQLAIHAIGDRANALLLDIFDSLQAEHGARDRRWRVEHAQHLRPADFERYARLGVIAAVQPYHAIDDGRWAEKRIGPDRIKTTYAFRSFLDAGVVLAFGSDWTVAPLDPMLGVYAAVTRRTIDGANPDGWMPQEKVSVDEALRAYTAANAYALFMEERVGLLKPGYAADLVLLDAHLMEVAPEELDRVSVEATLVGGRIVYLAGS
jgi:predicted amidohydrolase YtcJ